MSSQRGVGRATHENLTVAYITRVGILIGRHAFNLSILYSRREVNHLFLLILTILFRPGVGILIIQNLHPMPEKCRKHSLLARVFYISLLFSNACRVLSQCNTRLRLLYLSSREFGKGIKKWQESNFLGYSY